MELDKHSRHGSEKRSRFWLIALFTLLIIFVLILALIAVYFIYTQKPVDLGPALTTTAEQVDDRPRTTIRGFRKLKTKPPSTYRKFTFDDLFSGKIFLKDGYETAWTHDGRLIRKKDEFFGLHNGLSLMDPNTFEDTDYISESSMLGTISSSGKYGYSSNIVRYGFRHSNEEVYVIHKIENGSRMSGSYAVGPKGDGNETILLFQWNPNPERSDFVFVHEYNLYYQSDPERPGTAVQITNDGEEFFRYGVTDWLYEEEVLQSKKAVWWSPSGRYISYMRFDDRNVNRIFVPKYPAGSAYPEYLEVSYPKAGVQDNPLGTLYIWDRQRNTVVVAFPPEELLAMNQSYYIFSNNWIKMPKGLNELGDERMVTVWANREQTVVYITLCNEDDCVLTLKQSFVINGISMWAEPHDFEKVFVSTKGFFIILPHPHQDGNVYNHVAHVQVQANGDGKITAYHGGSYDVKSILGYAPEDDVLTFNSAGGGIGTMKLFRVNKATTDKASVHPISSYLPECEYGSFTVSPNGQTATLSCNRIFKNTRLWVMDIKKPERNKLLDGNDDPILPFDLPGVSFEIAKLASGYDIYVGMMKPPNFDPNRKYPILIDVYGGPNSNKIRRTTPGPNFIHYCSYYEIIIVWVDGRGTGNRGWNMKAPVYKSLGLYEATDTVDAVKYLANKYSYIDESNIAIFGWSYGGFLSTHVAALDQGKTVKCAVAVAPVTDLALYDSAYTERYMGMPMENANGYNQSKLTNKYAQLSNVRYLMAHGEADDNVHFQHSALLSEALQGHLVHFTQLVYSNQDHSMGARQKHLFKEVGLFLQECFNLPSNSALQFF